DRGILDRRRVLRCVGPAFGREVGDVVALDLVERLVGLQPAVARAGQGGVGAAPAVGEDRRAAALQLLLLIAMLGLLGGELGLRADVHAPAGEPGGEAGVLTLPADRER